MKIKNLLLISLTALFFLGCSGSDAPSPNGEEEEKLKDSDYIAKEAADTPYWIKDPKSLDGLAALGRALKTTGGSKFQQTEAVARARESLRDLVNEKVSKSVKESLAVLIEEADLDEDVFTVEEIEAVSKKIGVHVSLQVISGSKKKAIWFDSKENLYVLVSIDEDIVKKLTLDGTRMILRTKKDLYKEYRKNGGREILKRVLEKEIYN